jgi:hypothetical protein
MGIAGHTPNFTAAGTILPFSCVEATTTDPFKVVVATAETDIVLGVTDGSTRAFDSTNNALAGDPVVLQNSEFLQLRAGGTIAIGDGLCPTTNGAVITATSRIQFVACEAASSGEILWAQRVGSVEPNIFVSGFYGSRRAGVMIRDAIAGTDSIDVLVVGDSNAGSNDYGYTVGLDRVFGYQYGIDMYATPMLAGGRWWGSPDSYAAVDTPLYENMISTGVFQYSNDDNTAGGTGSTGNQRLMVQCPADTGNDALETYLNFSSTNYATTATTMLPQPNRWQWNPVVIPSGTVWTGTGISNAIRVRSYSPLTFSGAQSSEYRLVYGTYATGSGQFKLAITNGSSTTYAVSSFISTNNGTASAGYATESLAYTSPSTPVDLWCTWDGAASAQANSRLVTGPFACLWQSFVAIKKGYSVTNLTTSDGRSTTQIADRVENMDKVLDALLQELRERQVAAGGSGRLVVFVNSGVNGSETSGTWTAAAERIRNRISTRWISTGGDAEKLAFVFTVTHQLNPSYSGSGSAWITARATVSPAANAWATTNAGDGYGACVVDTSVAFDYFKLTNGSSPTGTMYSVVATDQIHLNSSFSSRSNGYDGVAGSIIGTIIASA